MAVAGGRDVLSRTENALRGPRRGARAHVAPDPCKTVLPLDTDSTRKENWNTVTEWPLQNWGAAGPGGSGAAPGRPPAGGSGGRGREVARAGDAQSRGLPGFPQRD